MKQTVFKRTAASAVLSVIGLTALSQYLRWNGTLLNLCVMLLSMVLAGLLTFEWLKGRNQRTGRFGLVFGLVFVLLQACGRSLSAHQTIAARMVDFLWLGLSAVCLAPAAGGGFLLFERLMNRLSSRASQNGSLKDCTVFWGSTAILLLCWLPYLLAFYPGLFTYDISWQYEQYQTWTLNTHHPLLHTLMVGWFCDLGWHLFGYPAKGLFLYTVFQMTLMAMAMASAIRLLYRQRVPNWVCVLILVLNAVLPFHPLLAVSSTKDTLFSGAVLYLCVVLMEASFDGQMLKRPWWMIRFVLAQAAVGLMRNNGFVCLCALLLAAVIGMIRRQLQAKKLAALALCGLLLYNAGASVLKNATDAEDGHFREMLSVPLQQAARVYALTQDEAKSEIAVWLPTVELYSPHLADLVKNTFECEKEQLPAFFKLWAEVGLRHPVVYLDSVLLNIAGFYDLGALPTGEYLETTFHTDEGRWMVEDSKWPAFKNVVSRLYSQNEYLNIPALRYVLSPSSWIWLMLLCFWTAVCSRNQPVTIAGFVLTALYLTALLSPCVMLRYTYPFVLCAPLLFGGLLAAQTKR